MKFTVKIIAVALSAFFMVLAPANATDADICAAAKAHARAGQASYGAVFDKAEEYLISEEIPHYVWGRKQRYQNTTAYSSRFSEKTCPMVSGGCGADKFYIDVSLYRDGEPVALITIKPGAKDTEFGYLIIGKLSGVIRHNACGGGEFIDGHTWVADPDSGHINGNVGRKIYVKTSLSQVGRMVARGYQGSLPSYEDKTLVIKVEDFISAERYEEFSNIIEPISVSGIMTYAD
ncbi:MAG: hypothetical protein COB56_05765 [Robiginitomaculum sp.]|nr:MAG: hypothetical protein COB56_05765 [Robiginitomaculum sp.]